MCVCVNYVETASRLRVCNKYVSASGRLDCFYGAATDDASTRVPGNSPSVTYVYLVKPESLQYR